MLPEHLVLILGGIELVLSDPAGAAHRAVGLRGVGRVTMREARRYLIEHCVQEARKGNTDALDWLLEVNRWW